MTDMARGESYRVRVSETTHKVIISIARRLKKSRAWVINYLIKLGIESLLDRRDVDARIKLEALEDTIYRESRQLDRLERTRKTLLRDHPKGYRYLNLNPRKISKIEREILIARNPEIKQTLESIRNQQDYHLKRISELLKKSRELLEGLDWKWKDLEKMHEEAKEVVDVAEEFEISKLLCFYPRSRAKE